MYGWLIILLLLFCKRYHFFVCYVCIFSITYIKYAFNLHIKIFRSIIKEKERGLHMLILFYLSIIFFIISFVLVLVIESNCFLILKIISAFFYAIIVARYRY